MFLIRRIFVEKTDNFTHWKEIIDLLEKGGMTSDPHIQRVCRWFVKTNGDHKPLENLLKEKPWVLNKARKNIAVIEKAEEENPFRPFPEGDELEAIQGSLNLGRVNLTGGMAGIEPVDFTKGFFVSGASDRGKTYPILRMLDQILSVPPAERGFNVIILQKMKHDADAFAIKYPHFKVIDWEDFRYNMWQVDDWDTPKDKLVSASEIFAGENFLYTLSAPPMKYTLQKSYEANGVFSGSKNFPIFNEFLSITPGYLKKFKIDGYNMKDSIGRLINRFIDFLMEGEILNCKAGFPLEFFLKHDLCFNVMNQEEVIVRTTFMNIFSDIQRYLQNNPTSEQKIRVLVIIDEARWLFDIKRDNSDIPSNKILESWFTTSRASGFGKIILTQEPNSVSRFVTSNCAYRWSFPIAETKALETVKSLNTLTDKQVAHIPYLAIKGEGILSHPGFPRPFIVNVPPDLELDKSISPDEIKVKMKPFIDELHLSLSPTVEEEKVELFDIDKEKKQAIDKLNSIYAIKRLVENPFIPYTVLRDDILKISAGKMRGAIDLLYNEGLAVSMECRGPKGPKVEYIALTDRVPREGFIKPSFFRHTLYEFRIMGWLKSKGYAAIREYYGDEDQVEPGIVIVTTKSGEEIKILKRIDVLGVKEGKRIAYEITLSFSNLLDNIHKCLEIFKVDEVHIVTEDAKKRDKRAKQIVYSKVPSDLLQKIKFDKISDFCLPGNV